MSSRRLPESPMGWRGESPLRSMSPPTDKRSYNFDALLQKIESEQNHLSSRTGALTRNTSPSPVKYDFAKRAKELRLSMDRSPSITASPSTTGAAPLSALRNGLGPRTAFNAPIQTSSSFLSRESPSHAPDSGRLDGAASSIYRTRDSPPTAIRPTVSFSSPYLNGIRADSMTEVTAAMRRTTSFTLPQTENTSVVNTTTNAAPLNERRNNGTSQFSEQVEQFRKNLIYAHDTISALQRDVRNLEEKISDKDNCIANLERKNKSLNEVVEVNKSEMAEMRQENKDRAQQNDELIKKHAAEVEKMKAESERHKNQAIKIDKLSTEFEETTDELEKTKRTLEDSVRDKDQMIGSLRKEISRLNEELSDGSYVRAQAKKAEERAVELELELQKARGKFDAASKTIADLKAKNEKLIVEQEQEKLELENSKDSTFAERTNRLKEKVAKLEAELDKNNTEKDDLADQVKILEKRLGRDAKIASKKDEDIKTLEKELAESEARENQLKAQLEMSSEKLKSQRARFEEYSNECAIEQETVAALEHAIEQLEEAQNDKYEENRRLKEENARLSKTVEDAELCVRNEEELSRKLKHMLDELAEINHDLGEQLRSKEDSILSMKATEEHLTTLLQSAQERNLRLEAERDMKIETSRTEASGRILDLESKLEAKEGLLMALQKDYGALKINHESTTMKVEASKSESSHLIRELEIKLKAKEGTLSSLQKEFSAVKAAHEASTLELYSLRDESSANKETKMKLDAVTLLGKAKFSEFEELKADRERMLEVISTLESELDQLRIEREAVERTETEADESRELRHYLEVTVKEMQAELNEAHEEASGARARVYQLEDAVTHLKEALEKSHENSKAAWQRLKEIEDFSGEDKSSEGHLRLKLAKLEKKLDSKDMQLDESRKGIAEAQKMIYRLMETVKELRKRARDHGLDDLNIEFRTAAE